MTQEIASKLVLLAVLKKKIAALEAEVKAKAVTSMDRGDRKIGKAGDTRIGSVTITDPKAAYRVTDGEAWRAWVREHRPEEIVTVESVRSSFESAILAAGGVLDPDTGESVLPDGIGLVAGAPVVQVRPERDAESLIRAELSAAGVSFSDVLAQLEAS